MELTSKQEWEIFDFHLDLMLIDGPDDMFPPDETAGDREPRQPQTPPWRGAAQLCLANIYDLAAHNS